MDDQKMKQSSSKGLSQKTDQDQTQKMKQSSSKGLSQKTDQDQTQKLTQSSSKGLSQKTDEDQRQKKKPSTSSNKSNQTKDSSQRTDQTEEIKPPSSKHSKSRSRKQPFTTHVEYEFAERLSSTVDVDNATGQTLPILTLPKVGDTLPKIPPYTQWTYTPKNFEVLSKDSRKELNWIPYFDEKTLDHEQNYLASFGGMSSTAVIGDQELYELLTRCREDEKQSVVVAGSSSGLAHLSCNKYTTVTREDLEELRFLPESLQEKLLKDCPSQSGFEKICDSLKIDKSYVESLKRRYMKICVLQNTETGQYLNSPNLDGNSVGEFKKEDTMNSYHRLFCQRCRIYNCQLHFEVGVPPYFKEKLGPAVELCLKECGDNCGRTNPLPNSVQDCQNQSSSMSEADKVLFYAIIHMYSNNPCAIAQILMKDCNQVMKYALDEGISFLNVNPGSASQNINKVTYKHKSNRIGKLKFCNKKSSKKLKNPIHDIKHNSRYIPCMHPGTPCSRINNCACKENDRYCEKFCTCDENCCNAFKGCVCSGTCSSRSCPCFAARRECDPDLCKKCGAHEVDIVNTTCKNVVIQRQLSKHLLLAPSTILNAGWGIFTKYSIEKDEFVSEYCGEIICKDEAEARALVYDKRGHTFMFDLDNESMVDGMRFGNKIRFANHSDNPNCESRLILVNGDHRIGVYAKKAIEAGDELFLNYGNVLLTHKKEKENREEEIRRHDRLGQVEVEISGLSSFARKMTL